MTSPPPATVSRFAWIVVALTAAARFGLLAYGTTLGDEVFLQPDSATYIAPAEAILACGRFSISPAECDVAEVLRTPGYSLLIAVCRALFGPSIVPLLVVQIFLAAWTQLLTWRLADRLGGPRAGDVAVVLSALQLNATHYAVQVLTETLFTALLTPSVWLLVRALDEERGRARRAALAGLLLAAATFVRPTTFFLPWPMAALLCALLLRRRARPRLALATALAFAACATLPLHAWQLRNRAATGYGGFSAIGPFNLVFYRAAGVEALSDDVSFSEAQLRLASRVGTFDPRDPARSVENFKTEAVRVLRRHWQPVIRITLAGAARMMFAPGDVDFMDRMISPSRGNQRDDEAANAAQRYIRSLSRTPPGLLPIRILSSASLVAMLVGAALSMRHWTAASAVLLFAAAYFVAVSAGPEAYARMRIPVEPMLVAVASAEIVQSVVARVRSRSVESKFP